MKSALTTQDGSNQIGVQIRHLGAFDNVEIMMGLSSLFDQTIDLVRGKNPIAVSGSHKRPTIHPAVGQVARLIDGRHLRNLRYDNVRTFEWGNAHIRTNRRHQAIGAQSGKGVESGMRPKVLGGFETVLLRQSENHNAA